MGLLYAPTTGKETRSLATRTMHHATDEAHELAAHARHFVDEKAHVFKSKGMPTRVKKEEQLHHNTLGIGLLTGLLIGGIVALLYAPKSGKETRTLLRNKAEETSHEAVEFAGHAKDFAAEEVRKVKAAAAAVKHEVETQHT